MQVVDIQASLAKHLARPMTAVDAGQAARRQTFGAIYVGIAVTAMMTARPMAIVMMPIIEAVVIHRRA